MQNDRTFLKCAICGNMIEMIEDSGAEIHCCGQEMTLLSLNTVDASKEKHVPSSSIRDGIMTVTIGSVPHPMTKEHHIDWIAVAQYNRTQRVSLNAEAPTASFHVQRGNITIYAYCNLHGLWASEATWQEAEDTIICSAEFAEGCRNIND